MALTGVLQADFSSFTDAVTRADVTLRSFETGAARVEASLNKMTDGFSGRRVIQDATLMAEAIERAGGVTRLTANELARAGAQASEAAAKMRALGIDVPERLTKITTAASDAATSIERVGPAALRSSTGTADLSKTMQQFDGALAAVGIQIGPHVRAVAELGEAGGKTALSLGALATAGLAVAAATAGWEFGRWIAGWLQTDTVIADATARLLGWGDVAAQEAGAGADVLARASEHAGRSITSFTEALAINAAAVEKVNDRYTDWAGRMAAAHERLAELSTGEIAQIELAQKLGATQKELTHDFNITADVVVLLRDRIKDLDTVGRIWGAGAAGIHADLVALDEAGRALEASFAPINPLFEGMIDSLARIDPYMEDWVNSLHAAATAVEAEVTPALAAMDLEVQSTTLSFSQAMDAVRRGEGTMSATIQTPADSTDARWRIMEAYRNGRYFGPVNTDGTPNMAAIFSKAPSFAGGVENFAGGLAKVHAGELLVNLPQGTDVVPAGRAGGGGGLTINQSFSGMVGDTAALAQMIKQALVHDYQTFGYRGPVPVGS